MSLISAVYESRKRTMTIGPAPVGSKLRAGPRSTLGMIDTPSEVAAENVKCPLDDEPTKADQVPDLTLMVTTTLTVMSFHSNLEDIEASLMNRASEAAVVAEPVMLMTVTLRSWIRRMSPVSVRGSQMADRSWIPRALIEAAKEVRECASLVRSFPP
jgi:hypothetical protein